MKKLFGFLLVLLLAVTAVSASVVDGNRQAVWSVDSDVYEAIKYLYIAEGLALPSSAGPWSAAEIDIMMDRFRPEGMDSSARNVYDWICGKIGRSPRIAPTENFGAEIGMRTTLEASYHSNAEDFISADSLGGRGDWRPQKPLISVPLETWIGKYMYGYSALEFGVTRSFNSGFGGYNWLTNIWMVPPSTLGELSLNFPLRAIGSVGGEFWNLTVGKEKISWGPGESGNLMVGDQVPFHNTARLTGFAEHFKYTLVVSSFAHPMNYTTPRSDNLDDKQYLNSVNESPYGGPFNENRVCDYDQSEVKDGISMFIGHRLEWRIAEKVGMALSESMMYQSATNRLDLMILSPTAVFHNGYIRGNSNSLLSFDIDYTPMDYLNIYGSVLIDEFEMPGEIGTNDGPPSAHGWIVGAKTGVPLGGGMLHASLEAAYTDPYLYLRGAWGKYSGDNASNPYGINFIVATPEFNNASGNYTLQFLGYRYGNDAAVANLDVGYKVYGKWFVDAEYTYLADGTYDMNTRWMEVQPHSEKDPTGPTDKHNEAGSFNPNDTWYSWDKRNAVAHWNIVSLRGGITLFDTLDFWGEMNYINILNFGNVKGKTTDDFQMTVGISYYL